MIIKDIYMHPNACIVETESSYVFFSGHNVGCFKIGEELHSTCEPYKVLMKWNTSDAIKKKIVGE